MRTGRDCLMDRKTVEGLVKKLAAHYGKYPTLLTKTATVTISTLKKEQAATKLRCTKLQVPTPKPDFKKDDDTTELDIIDKVKDTVKDGLNKVFKTMKDIKDDLTLTDD